MYYSLTRATTWNVLGYIYLIIASFISTPILIHGLGIAGFSEYSLILASTILVSAINLGLPQAVVRALSRDHEFSPRRQTIWASSSLLFIISGVVAGAIAAIFASYTSHDLSVLVLVFAICLMNNLVTHYSTLPQAEGHFGYYNAKTFIVGTGNTLLAAYLASRGFSITGILAMQLGTYFLTLLPLAYFSLKFFPNPRAGVSSLKVGKSLIAFGLKNQVGTIVGQVQAQYAKYLMSAISPVSLSAYVIAQGLVQKAVGGVSQLGSALYPAASRSTKLPELRSIYHRLQLSLLALGVSSVGIYHLIGLPFLVWWLHSSELVFQIDSIFKYLIWYFAILILMPLSSAVLDSRGRPELTSIFATITTVIEIAIAVFLFPAYGLFAPIYACLIALVITTPFVLYQVERLLGEK